MSTLESQNDGQNDTVELNEAEERKALMARAQMMGITFSNNIGTDTLRERIREKMEGKAPAADAETQPNPLAGSTAAPKKRTLSKKLYDEQMKLVRLRIQNLDPKKKDLPGEIFTVANEFLGMVKKFVPYGEVSDDGYHVPYCIYRMLANRKFLQIRTVKDRRTGIERVESKWVKEFVLDILPALTPQQIQDLKTAQIAAGSLD